MFFQIANKGNNNWLTYLGGFLIIILLSNLINGLFLFVGKFIETIFYKKQSFEEFINDFNYMEFSTNYDLVLLFAPFVIGLIIIYLVIRILHKRNFLSAVTSRRHFDIKRLFIAFLIFIVLNAVYFIIDYHLFKEDYTFQLNLNSFIILCVISLLFIPFQCAFEEILFRGYLLQGIGFVTKSRWIALLLTSIIFGLFHSFNPEVDRLGFWNIMPYYIGFGMLLGVIAIMDNGLEISIGLHTANNIFTATILTYDDSIIQTNALFKLNDLTIGLTDYLILFVLFILTILIFNTKYKWGSFSKVFTPISF